MHEPSGRQDRRGDTKAATALIAFEAAGDLLAVFTTLALLSTFVYVFGHVLSVAAEICHSLARRTRDGPPTGTLAIAAIALAMVFSLWMASATGAQAVQRGTMLISSASRSTRSREGRTRAGAAVSRAEARPKRSGTTRSSTSTERTQDG